MKWIIRAIAATLISISSLFAQTSTYNDVAVIINTNSPISDSIGMYFAHARNIPSENIIRVNAPTIEEIDNLQFENLRSQVEQYLTSNNLRDKINYIVTTKGVPLKVKRIETMENSSVESELTIILGPYASEIGKSGRVISPYYRMRDDFSRSKYGIYLVTRLDGYTLSDIKAMINRAASIPSTISSYARFVFDMDPAWTLNFFLNNNMKRAIDSLSRRSLVSILDTTTVYLTGQSNLLGYISWGSNDHNWKPYAINAIPKNTYLPGAIGETYVSTSARSFASPPVYGQSLVADLVAEGITAVKGYTYEPYSSALVNVSMLYPMYADGYTVAECFYSSSVYLSWMDVVVGDPKFRLTKNRMPADTLIVQPNGNENPLPVTLTDFSVKANGFQSQLKWNTATEVNNYGFEIERRLISELLLVSGKKNDQSQINQLTNNLWIDVGFVTGAGTSNSLKEYSYTDKELTAGRYEYRLKQIDNDGTFKYSQSVEVTFGNVSNKVTLLQNHPNPFNPTTTIEFTLPENGNASLKVYNVIGQEIVTLFNGNVEAGINNRVTFNASQLSSGMYFSVLEYGNQKIVKKMMLTK